MSSHKNNDLVIFPLDEDNLLTQHERPGQRADANKKPLDSIPIILEILFFFAIEAI